MSQLAVKQGVVFKRTTLGGLLLDVSGDRFLALRPLGARLWQRCAEGGDRDSLLRELRAPDLGLEPEFAESLVDRQLQHWRSLGLLDAPLRGPLPLSKPITSLSAKRDFTPRGRLSGRALIRLLQNEIKCRRELRRGGLAAALVQLQQQSAQRPARHDVEIRLSRIVLAYRALRLVYRQGDSARDCLIRSLALVGVLRHYGIAADVCVGVREMPFASHAWVEVGDLILNETQSQISSYEPMARF